jgi:hypothetical protein
MGCTQSAAVSQAARLTPEQQKARRAEIIKFRSSYAKLAQSIKPPSNCQFTVEVEPWIAAPEGTRGVDDALASFQRGSHASTREINMALCGLISVDDVYDYKKSVVLSIKDSTTKDVISAALMVEHDTSGGTIMELIWFVTQRKNEDKKYGTVLFRCIRDLTKKAGCKALLITSTPQATGFWLLYLVRRGEKFPEFSTTLIRHKNLDAKMKKAEKELSEKQKIHFEYVNRRINVARHPGSDVRSFYRPYSGSNFLGVGFRYKTDVCSHIWLKLDGGGSSSQRSLLRESSKSVREQSSRTELKRDPSLNRRSSKRMK